MRASALARYLSASGKAVADVDPGFVAYLASLDAVAQADPAIASSIVAELDAQRSNIKLIASENYSSIAVQSAMGNLLTDKYAEGVPGARFYAGCENVDRVEETARELVKALFGAEHAYVQPHSGADANLVAFWAILSQHVEMPALASAGLKDCLEMTPEAWESLRQALGRQRLMGMDLSAGGHLTHGFRRNVSARIFETLSYGVDPQTGMLDYDALHEMAARFKPLILLAGYSAYPRRIDFARMRRIADAVGAVLMVDMAHFAGLVAGKAFEGDFDPVRHAQVVTTTTHKTLRGPRGGLVLCTKEYAAQVDKGCPLVLGGPLPHVMAAKALAFKEALAPEFRQYARAIVENARALAAGLVGRGLRVTTGGTDNHLMVVDVTSVGVTGRQGELALRHCGITLNRNAIPNDPHGAWYTSGLRLGTPAVTTLGMGVREMDEIAAILALVLSGTSRKDDSKAKFSVDDRVAREALSRVRALLTKFPVYPAIDLGFLQSQFGAPAVVPAAR
jgi:glycine hydroxymethyltransferase